VVDILCPDLEKYYRHFSKKGQQAAESDKNFFGFHPDISSCQNEEVSQERARPL
jgi:hypothetical protein